MNRPTRVALVGCGKVAGIHAAALASIPQHGLYATDLSLDASETAQQIGSDVLGQLHGGSIPPGVSWSLTADGFVAQPPGQRPSSPFCTLPIAFRGSAATSRTGARIGAVGGRCHC